jgi:hypothetical protein
MKSKDSLSLKIPGSWTLHSSKYYEWLSKLIGVFGIVPRLTYGLKFWTYL